MEPMIKVEIEEDDVKDHNASTEMFRRSHENSKDMQKPQDQSYLKTVLGKILPRALCEICEKRPPDPIEELARWLYQWADCELYYYEKAIFARELQLMALQLEKENARTMARMHALKKEINAVKYILSNDHAFESLLRKTLASRAKESERPSSLLSDADKEWKLDDEMDLLARSRKRATDELSLLSKTSAGTLRSSDYQIGQTLRKSSPSRRHKKGTSVDYGDDGLSEISDRKRHRKGQEYDIDGFPIPKQKGTRTSKRNLQIQAAQHLLSLDIDSFGPDIKKMYGFSVTPVRCHWYLAEPRVLVCVHPVLGELRATIPSITTFSETPEWWQQKQYRYEVLYDHEVYTRGNPNFDDEQYEGMVELWPYDDCLDEDVDEEKEPGDQLIEKTFSSGFIG